MFSTNHNIFIIKNRYIWHRFYGWWIFNYILKICPNFENFFLKFITYLLQMYKSSTIEFEIRKCHLFYDALC